MCFILMAELKWFFKYFLVRPVRRLEIMDQLSPITLITFLLTFYSTLH
jgi:hypothetical protein